MKAVFVQRDQKSSRQKAPEVVRQFQHTHAGRACMPHKVLLHGRESGPPIPARPVSPSRLSYRSAVSAGFAGSRVPLPMACAVFVGGHPSAGVDIGPSGRRLDN